MSLPVQTVRIAWRGWFWEEVVASRRAGMKARSGEMLSSVLWDVWFSIVVFVVVVVLVSVFEAVVSVLKMR